MMALFSLLGWLVYGVIVGLVAKSLYKDAPSGFVGTLLVGISGSFVGGFVKYLLTESGNPFQPSGILLGILGGIIACYILRKIKEM
jgi:uncharacterized membrane protein YeaQ/YmgE (transglycosylase-associated protein family)